MKFKQFFLIKLSTFLLICHAVMGVMGALKSKDLKLLETATKCFLENAIDY